MLRPPRLVCQCVIAIPDGGGTTWRGGSSRSHGRATPTTSCCPPDPVPTGIAEILADDPLRLCAFDLAVFK